MAYFTPEQIAKAKEIDLFTYLQHYNPDELVYESRNSYTTRTHDSLKISNGMWYWFSRGIGGKTALEYLIQVEGYSFTEAVEHLINQKGLEKRYKQKLTEKEKITRLQLPKRATDNYKIFKYLSDRGISREIIDECINKGFIYQDYPRKNVVFLGMDENNIPRYAALRGTSSKRFMGEASGSDKAYSFKLDSIIPNNEVHVFESAIDLLSFATLKELNNDKWDELNLLSLAGVYKPPKDISKWKTPETLSHYLKKNQNINKIFLHFDNDVAGRLATKTIQKCLSDSYEIIDEPPKIGKDYNDFLCIFLKEKEKKYSKKCRQISR